MDPDVEIMFAAQNGKLISEKNMFVHLKQDFNRHSISEDDLLIERIWDNRIKENPRLFNGTKFRVHSVSVERPGTLTMNLGVTDYREYLGTNWSPEVHRLQATGKQRFSNPQTFLSDPLGVGALAVTSDDYVIFLRRSMHLAEAPGMWDIPGGHAEPEELVGKVAISDMDLNQLVPEAVVHEIFNSILREIRDEVNISEVLMSPPLLMGIARNTTSGGRPSLEFLVRCSIPKDEVLAQYQKGVQAEADESTNILMLPLKSVSNLHAENPALWATVAPSAKGCIILHTLSHGL